MYLIESNKCFFLTVLDCIAITSGDHIALAINAASAVLWKSGLPFEGPAACVRVCLSSEGEMLQNPSQEELKNSCMDLLYAGTRDRTLMIEFGSKPKGLESIEDLASYRIGVPEERIAELIEFSHSCIQDIIEAQNNLPRNKAVKVNEDYINGLKTELGLSLSSKVNNKDSIIDKTNEAIQLVEDRLLPAALKHFNGTQIAQQYQSKVARGTRERLLRDEVSRIISSEYDSSTFDEKQYLTDVTAKNLFCHAMREAAFNNQRSDGRQIDEVRPITISVPIFPESVHGSCSFSRGSTQVICTTTLGSPKEGLPISDALEYESGELKRNENYDETKLPVGCIRSTRNETSLLSDLNSRKVIADREHTGESGTLNDVQQVFLHYDFPGYATGEISSNKGSSRREIGHGALAERAILSAMPPASIFPYSVRITSEVTSSNGSSSMATVCGATLSLLDAGVRMLAPIAGTSVGLVIDENEGKHSLLLDLTGEVTTITFEKLFFYY